VLTVLLAAAAGAALGIALSRTRKAAQAA
jgi:hypothetical protein